MEVFLPTQETKRLGLSASLLSFARCCLAYEPEERGTAQQLLEHPFLQVRYNWRYNCTFLQYGGGGGGEPIGLNSRSYYGAVVGLAWRFCVFS
ncbi:unnamed protein product [Choristocarpus tenellus]